VRPKPILAALVAAVLFAAAPGLAVRDVQMGAFSVAPEQLAQIQKLVNEARILQLGELGESLVAVGHAPVEGTDAASLIEAQRTAEADAKGHLGEFIHGLTTETSEELKTMEKVVSIVSDGQVKEQSQVEELYTQSVRTQSRGVLRATRILASWSSDDGSLRTVAVVFSRKFLEESGPTKGIIREGENTLTRKALEGQRAIRSVGTAPVVGGDVATARGRAIDFARENAVREGLGTLVESETVANEVSTKIRLREKTRGYVIEDAVVGESHEGQFYRVVLDAVVSTELMNKDLRAFRALQEQVGMPRIAVRLKEAWKDGRSAPDEAGAKLNELFQENGYRLVSAATPDAEVEIQGTVTLADAGKDRMDRMLVNATTDLRAVIVSTGQLLASAQDTQRVAMPNPGEAASMAAKRAASQTFKKLHAQIVEQWGQMARGGSSFVVVLQNVTSYAQQGRAFQKLLEGLHGAGSVQRTAFANGTLELGVQFRGTSADLEEAIFAGLAAAGLSSVDYREGQGNRLVFYCK
jgi:hypothetical protein